MTSSQQRPVAWHRLLRSARSTNTIIQVLHDLEASGLHELKTRALSALGLSRLPALRDDTLIEQTIPKTPHELEKWSRRPAFYRANLVAFLRAMSIVLSDLPTKLTRAENGPLKDLVCQNYQDLIQTLLFDFEVLLDRHRELIANEPAEVRHFKNPVKHTYELYQVLRQILFGQYSYHSFTDRDFDAAPLMIRQVLEVRMRRAVGVIAAQRGTSDKLVPIPLDVILDVMKEHAERISMPIPIHNIQRIYRWANLFVHAALRDYVWKSIVVTEYIHPLMVGKRDASGFDVSAGITMSKATFSLLRAQILERVRESQRTGITLISCPREAKLADSE